MRDNVHISDRVIVQVERADGTRQMIQHDCRKNTCRLCGACTDCHAGPCMDGGSHEVER